MDLLLFIVLLILKIIVTFLIILFVLLFIILNFIAFVPIRYHVFFKKEEKIDFETEIKWFFKLFLVNLKYFNDDFSMLIKIFNKEVINTRKTKENINKKVEKKEKEIKESPIKSKGYENNQNEKTLEIASIEKTNKKIEPKVNLKKEVGGPKRINTKAFTEKKIFSLKSIFRKKEKQKKHKKEKKETNKKEEFSAEYFLKLPLEDKKTMVKHLLIFIKRILKHTAPKDVKFDLKIGTDDPALTGQIIGGIYAVSALIKSDVNAVGDFEKPMLQGSAILKGRIQIFYFLYSIFCLIKVKIVWKTIILFLKGTGGKNGK